MNFTAERLCFVKAVLTIHNNDFVEAV